MNLAAITPRAHGGLAAAARLFYALAPLCEDDERTSYRGYASVAGRGTILDNGAYEGEPMDVVEYIELARKVRPTILILPDRIGDPEATLQAHRLACSLIVGDQRDFARTQILAVPQAIPDGTPQQAQKDALQFLERFEYLEMVDGLALSWRGLGQEGTCARARFVENIHAWVPDPGYIHLLGLENDPEELQILAHACRQRGVKPDSLDTSAPVRQACSYNGAALSYISNGLYPGPEADILLSRECFFEYRCPDHAQSAVSQAAATNIRRAQRYLEELFE